MKRPIFHLRHRAYYVRKSPGCAGKRKRAAWKKRLAVGILFIFGAFISSYMETKGEDWNFMSVYKENREYSDNNMEQDFSLEEGSYTEEELLELKRMAEQENGLASMAGEENSAALEEASDNLHILVGDSCLGNEIDEYSQDFSTQNEEFKENSDSSQTPDGGAKNREIINGLLKKRDLSYMLKNFYIVNPTTSIDTEVFDVDKLLEMDCTIKKSSAPQILIFHTHGASEYFKDSRQGNKEDSVIGVGERLADILSKEYGYCVIHDETPYDLIDGEIDRNQAYTVAENALAKTLEKYPTIQVMIDLHRDASSDGKTKRVTTIDGKKCAQVMLFNGLSRNLSGDIEYLYNPNLQGNLGFSLQMKLKAMEYYEDFTLPIFLKGYRYSLHLREKSLLVELGNEVNTVKEAKNSMEPFAKVLDAVLSGK